MLEFPSWLTVPELRLEGDWDIYENCKSICDCIMEPGQRDFKGECHKEPMFDVCVLLLESLFFARITVKVIFHQQKYNRRNVSWIMDGSN